MVTVNSLSGGKTSSYLAVHYPADHEVFALVCNDDPRCGHKDKSIQRQAEEKIAKYSDRGFVGTPEDPKTLKVILDLEQLIGREIKWVRGESFDELISRKKALPNRSKRFCTTEMKMVPIFWWCYFYTELPVKMRVGYRYDEMERAERFTSTIKISKGRHLKPSGRWMNKWEDVDWRIGEFPLITDKIVHPRVQSYWKDKKLVFPEDSNCQMCFWKNEQQLRKNFDTNRSVMEWGKRMEASQGRTFRDKISLEQIEKIGLQMDFFFGTGSGCQAGFCTD